MRYLPETSLLKVLAISLVALLSIPAFAQSKIKSGDDVWKCIYPGYPAGSGSVKATYRQRTDFIVEDMFQKEYRILQNNQHSLVAAWSISAVEPGQAKPSIGGQTMVIDKSSGELLWSNTNPAASDVVNSPVRGKCILELKSGAKQ